MGWLIFFVVVGVIWGLAQAGKKSAPPGSSASGAAHSPNRYVRSVDTPGARTIEVTKNTEPGRWVSAGELVKVGGLTIPGGMIYVGGVMPQPRGYGTDNCLIDPSLRVAGANPDVLGETLGYWPSYSSISPRARLAYLEWLAGGRCDPSVSIGYVFLFFYGLERRAFVDGAQEDLPGIVDEVRRLLDLYGGNGSFNGYARRFLDMAELATVGLDAAPQLRPDLRDGFEIPIRVRVWLGKRLRAQEPLEPDDALMWVLGLPDASPRTAVTRCFGEFRDLWTARFREAYPTGLRVPAPKTELQVSYRPASGTFDGKMSIEGLPDVGVVTRHLGALRTLMEQCTDELDGYSRLLGRKPEARGALEAVLLLPPVLRNGAHAGPLAAVQAELDGIIANQPLVAVSAERLLAMLDLASPALARSAALRQAGVLLDALNLGFEPDRRYGGAGPTEAAQVVIFRQSPGSCDPEGVAFAAGRTMVEVATLAAAADGVIAPAEFESISSDLQAMVQLSADERTRLLAYTLALLKNPPRQQTVLNKLAKSPVGARSSIVQSALSAVLADGRVTPEEVKYLERLNKALGLPQDEVYALLHRGSVRVDEPTTVAAEVRDRGAAIPRPLDAAGGPVTLDPTRLERIRSETTAVSSLLAEIFVEEPHPASPRTAPTPQGATPGFVGLDVAHSELLAPFLDDESCSWTTFEARARALRLLPEGALETINDWAFDCFDEPLLESGDVIVAAAHLRPKLIEMGAAA